MKKIDNKDELTITDIEENTLIAKTALEQPITAESELKGVMKALNEDKIEPDTKLPSIDMKTRLHPFEISSIVIHDVVVALGCLPNECLLTTRTKKRLAVSLQGEGRKEMVKIVQGEREHERPDKNIFQRMFSPSEK